MNRHQVDEHDVRADHTGACDRHENQGRYGIFAANHIQQCQREDGNDKESGRAVQLVFDMTACNQFGQKYTGDIDKRQYNRQCNRDRGREVEVFRHQRRYPGLDAVTEHSM